MSIKDVPRTDFPARLKMLREANGLTVSRLAKMINLSLSAIHKLEADERQPYWRVVVSLCAALGVMPNDLLGDNDLRRLAQARQERNDRPPAPRPGGRPKES
jgi:transcriptional regulator with XRE-family HTH domain